MTLAQIIGDDLCTARHRAGLSQADVARRTGIHRPIIARLETGRHTHSVASLSRYARALGVPLADLVGPALDAWERRLRGAA